MTNPSANQNRPPRLDPFRYFACVSSAWLVLRAKEVAAARTAGPVSPGFSLDTESPAGEWVLRHALALMSAPTTPATPYARVI